MKVAVIGSRTLYIKSLEAFLPNDTTELISGHAKGVDSSVADYALKNHIPLTEYLPKYELYGKQAPILRNIEIVKNADLVIAFWDNRSRGTKFVMDYCDKNNIPIKKIIVLD